jgi:mannose-6-phosphate isomerase-like protein (cupin superfamily)
MKESMVMKVDIFEGKDEYIASKTPFFGKLDEGLAEAYDWNQHMDLLDWHPQEMIDSNSTKFRIGLNSFHLRPSAPEFAKEIVDQMTETFSLHGDKRKITNIAFTGFGQESDSYPWHKDSMDVFLVQVIGTVGLRVEGHNNDEEFDFSPGDYVWLPRGTHHQVLPRTSRCTFSFGVEGDPDPAIYF